MIGTNESGDKAEDRFQDTDDTESRWKKVTILNGKAVFNKLTNNCNLKDI